MIFLGDVINEKLKIIKKGFLKENKVLRNEISRGDIYVWNNGGIGEGNFFLCDINVGVLIEEEDEDYFFNDID